MCFEVLFCKCCLCNFVSYLLPTPTCLLSTVTCFFYLWQPSKPDNFSQELTFRNPKALVKYLNGLLLSIVYILVWVLANGGLKAWYGHLRGRRFCHLCSCTFLPLLRQLMTLWGHNKFPIKSHWQCTHRQSRFPFGQLDHWAQIRDSTLLPVKSHPVSIVFCLLLMLSHRQSVSYTFPSWLVTSSMLVFRAE